MDKNGRKQLEKLFEAPAGWPARSDIKKERNRPEVSSWVNSARLPAL